MAQPSNKTVRRLYAMSGNQCAFRGCDAPIIGKDGEELGVNFGEISHICAQSPGGPRFDETQTDTDRHDYANLILLCSRHHILIDSELNSFPTKAIMEMKQEHEINLGRAECASDAFVAKRLLDAMSTLSIEQNNGTVVVANAGSNISFRQATRRVVFVPPTGTIGADRDSLRYAKYLVNRYNEFASWDPDRPTKFHHGVIYQHITRRYRSKMELVPIKQFGDLCLYLEVKIKRTRLGKKMIAGGQPCYSTFDEFRTGV